MTVGVLGADLGFWGVVEEVCSGMFVIEVVIETPVVGGVSETTSLVASGTSLSGIASEWRGTALGNFCLLWLMSSCICGLSWIAALLASCGCLGILSKTTGIEFGDGTVRLGNIVGDGIVFFVEFLGM